MIQRINKYKYINNSLTMTIDDRYFNNSTINK
jgi:hypothetical protein